MLPQGSNRNPMGMLIGFDLYVALISDLNKRLIERVSL